MEAAIQKGVAALAGLVRWVRGERVMLDADLARLYGVETGDLNRAVKRNARRFPDDFMFVLDKQEVANLICQIGISSSGWGGRRKPEKMPWGVCLRSNFHSRVWKTRTRASRAVEGVVCIGGMIARPLGQKRSGS